MKAEQAEQAEQQRRAEQAEQEKGARENVTLITVTCNADSRYM